MIKTDPRHVFDRIRIQFQTLNWLDLWPKLDAVVG